MTPRRLVLLICIALAHCVLAGVGLLFAGAFKFAVTPVIGIVYGQVVLIAAWVALAKQRPLRRYAVSGVLCICVWLTVSLALRTVNERLSPVFVASVLASQIVIVVLVTRTVLVGARWLWRWRIELPGSTTRGDGRFSIRQAMLALALACVLLAIGRLAFMPGPTGDMFPGDAALVVVLVVATAIVAVVNAVVVVVGLAPFFNEEEYDLPLVLAGVPVFAVVATLIETVALALIFHVANAEGSAAIFGFNLGQFYAIAVTIALLRRIGLNFDRALPINDLPPAAEADASTQLAYLPPLKPL